MLQKIRDIFSLAVVLAALCTSAALIKNFASPSKEQTRAQKFVENAAAPQLSRPNAPADPDNEPEPSGGPLTPISAPHV